MGYLNNDSVIVDAILTKYGRRKLAQGQSLGITKFALSDDGVDYTAYNTSHPSGSANYADAITNLPLLEAVPDGSTQMKYKLYDAQRNTIYFPIIKGMVTSDVTLIDQEDSYTVSPTTSNFAGNESYHYHITDETFITVEGATRKETGYTANSFPADAEIPKAAIFTGQTITIRPKPTNKKRFVTLRVEGAQSGAQQAVTLTINANIEILPTA